MGNKRNRRSRRLETPSPEREGNRTRVDSPETGNMTLTNSNSNVDENLGGLNLGSQLVEPRQTSSEIQAWTETFERKNNDRIEKMREEMENKLDTILKEIKSNRSQSTVTNPRSQVNETEDMRPSGSRSKEPIGVHASNIENSELEDEDNPIRASKMTELKHPAKPLFRSESDIDVTIHSDEESDIEEDYHNDSQTSLQFNCPSECSSKKFFSPTFRYHGFLYLDFCNQSSAVCHRQGGGLRRHTHVVGNEKSPYQPLSHSQKKQPTNFNQNWIVVINQRF